MRPEHLAPGAHSAVLNLVGEFSESLGGPSQLYAQPVGESAEQDTLILSVPGRRTLTRGEALPVGSDPADAHVFDNSGCAIQ